jgi:hypothetical protein
MRAVQGCSAVVSVHGCAPTMQVKAARRLKRLLTGRLTSAVSSYPTFPGSEANYLRTQACCRMLLCRSEAAPSTAPHPYTDT